MTTAAAALLLTASLAPVSPAVADSLSVPAASGATLKWKVHRTATKRTTTSASPNVSQVERAIWQARGHAAAPSSRSPSYQSPRNQLRNRVVQASADKSDPFSDPFEDDPVGSDSGNGSTTRTSQPTTPDSPPRSLAEPGFGADSDLSTDQAMPPDLREMVPENESALPGLPPPLDESCDDYKKDCDEAVRRLRDRDITKIPFGLVITGEGGRPPVEGSDYPCECVLGENATFLGRNWAPTTFTWKATGTCFKPLYFQDVQLERYGHSWNPVLQPFMSAGHFFVSVPLLPYKMGLKPPCECVYSLGYYRPGSCAPYMIEPIPLSLRAGVFQALGTTAFAFWFWPPPTGP